jgi:hypothetical protein
MIMKQWIKFAAATLSFLILLSTVACMPTDVDAPVDENPDTEVEIFKNGVTQYKLIFDDENTTLTEQVYRYVDTLKSKYDITLEAIKASKATQVYDKEIIVGQVRPAAESVAAKMKPTGDFAMCVVEDDLVLCATDDLSYRYMFELLLTNAAYCPREGSLSLNADHNFVYHDSDFSDISYAAYLKQGGALTQNQVVSLFSRGSVTLNDGKKMVYRLYLPSNYNGTK